MALRGGKTWLVAATGAALGLAAGLAVGMRLGSGVAGAGPEPAPSERPAATSSAGDAEKARELEAEAIWWRTAYEDLARSLERPDAVTSPAAEPSAGADASVAGTLDVATLVAGGYTEAEAQRLQERFEAYQLDQLYLADRAKREGWRQSPRFFLESEKLREALQTELGDRDYDALLYAAGRTNRVVIAGVLAGSAAAQAGLREGDEVVSYDGERIFDAPSILRATSQGQAGATTELRIRRDGEEQRILLPRGPIGVRLQPERVAPDGF